MKHGSKIVLRGEAGCTEPGLQPGDVVLVLQQKEHDTFTRLPNPADLVFEKHISLREALCGCSFTVKHLDGRTIRISSSPGEVIKPNSFKVVPEEGMPVHTRPFIKGNLYIKFDVSGGLAVVACMPQAARWCVQAVGAGWHAALVLLHVRVSSMGVHAGSPLLLHSHAW
eukprot:GHRQ01015951.1.p4 GENE.GHRQ01015951.1~~GHRQ01015951.1.p4  ORF type:complete len:169 (-),score=68.12 GHRQ01015951.1:355-861(-)